MSLTRRRTASYAKLSRRAVGAAGLLALGIGALSVGAGAQDQDACANHTRFSTLGSAAGARTVQSAAGRSIITEVDANLPGAQASVDSVLGSRGWAGAPYIPVAAENAGQAHKSPNDVPVFASSEYPAVPKASNSTPAATVTATSDAASSNGKAESGGPSSDQAAMGRSIASAEASCTNDGGLHALADTSTDVTSVADVLRIGSVRSHALLDTDATGGIRKVEGTMAVEGVFVLGQPAAITDKGVVVGGSASPLPANPLADALKSAGITVRYIAADIDRKTGEVTAPGLEISVTKPVPGGDPVTTTYDLGRAYARVSLTAGDAPPSDAGAVDAGGGFAALPETPPADTGTAPAAAPSTPAATTARTKSPAPRRSGQLLATAQIGSWSVAPAYAALGIGTALLVVWVLLEMIAVRSRWR